MQNTFERLQIQNSGQNDEFARFAMLELLPGVYERSKAIRTPAPFGLIPHGLFKSVQNMNPFTRMTNSNQIFTPR